jgi:hypothetical protein
MKKALLASLMLVCQLCLFTSSAHSALLDFNLSAPTSGTISFAGGTSPLVGAGIQVDNVVGTSTPLNSGIISTCISCSLGFTSGTFTSSTANSWEFNGGGSITIVGGLDLGSDNTTNISTGSTLLDGSFISVSVINVGGGSLEFNILGASFTDTKHVDLLNYYGLPTGVNYDGYINLSFLVAAGISPGNAFTSTSVLSGDIVNSPVPVPPAVWLFGTGLIGLVAIARRRTTV